MMIRKILHHQLHNRQQKYCQVPPCHQQQKRRVRCLFLVFWLRKKPPSTTSVTTKRSTKEAAITIVSSTTELKNDTTDIKTTSVNEPSKKQVADANEIVENISDDPVVETIEPETKDGNTMASAAVHEAVKTPEKTKKKSYI